MDWAYPDDWTNDYRAEVAKALTARRAGDTGGFESPIHGIGDCADCDAIRIESGAFSEDVLDSSKNPPGESKDPA